MKQFQDFFAEKWTMHAEHKRRRTYSEGMSFAVVCFPIVRKASSKMTVSWLVCVLSWLRRHNDVMLWCYLLLRALVITSSYLHLVIIKPLADRLQMVTAGFIWVLYVVCVHEGREGGKLENHTSAVIADNQIISLLWNKRPIDVNWQSRRNTAPQNFLCIHSSFSIFSYSCEKSGVRAIP